MLNLFFEKVDPELMKMYLLGHEPARGAAI